MICSKEHEGSIPSPGIMTYNEFLIEVTKRSYKTRSLRYGQVFFDVLLDVRPDLAHKIAGTEHDPFHLHGYGGSSVQMDIICRYVESLW